MTVYFDNAATTAIHPEVLEAMMPYLTEMYGNPSAVHGFGRITRAAIEKSRKIIADTFNASSGEIFFTSGGTESNNMVIYGAVHDLGIKRIITSKIEHHCVLHPVEYVKTNAGAKVEFVQVDEKGRVDLSHLRQLLAAQMDVPTMVSLMHANNEIGSILDIDTVAEICYEFNVLFHCDTVQTIGSKQIDLKKTGLHFISGSAHKFHGPKGCGFVYIRSDKKLNPILFGGSQERNMRAGTENLYGIVGLGKAIEIAYRDFEQNNKHIKTLRDYMEKRIIELVPDAYIFGDNKGDRLDKVLNVGFPKSEKTSLLQFNLDIKGIAVSSGSACSSGSDKPSHVLGHVFPESNLIPIRFSFSRFNTLEEANFVLDKLAEVLPVTTSVSKIN